MGWEENVKAIREDLEKMTVAECRRPRQNAVAGDQRFEEPRSETLRAIANAVAAVDALAPALREAYHRSRG